MTKIVFAFVFLLLATDSFAAQKSKWLGSPPAGDNASMMKYADENHAHLSKSAKSYSVDPSRLFRLAVALDV